jgi:4-amino-4-deoxy-L-arabinose transferase-like glycosyltransferase
MNLFRARSWLRSGDNWFRVIILLALVLRTYHVAYPPWDYHNWRQTQTLMVARDFARHGFRLLYPQVQWVSNGPDHPSYFSGEFSIEGLLAALLYTVLGEAEVSARIVVITFSLLGIYFLYELLRRRAGPIAARLGAFIYAMLPYHLFFGRVFMPDVPALSLALGGLCFLDRWTENRKAATLFAAAALTSMAILQKLTVIVVGLPALYLFWLAQGRYLFVRRELYLFVAIVAAPSFAWYTHTNAMARFSGFAFVQPELFGSHLGSWFQTGFLHRTLAPLWSEAFSPIGLALSVLGFFWPARIPAFWIFRLWVIGAGFLLLLIPDLLSANYYYYSLLLPGGAALGGLAVARLALNRTAYPVLAVILMIFALEAIRSALPLFQDDRAPRDLGTLLNRLTMPSDLIVGESGGSPNVLYFADRRGWMLAQQYDVGLLQKLMKAGALYYADPSSADLARNREFFRAMDVNFERLTPDEGPWPIYRLSVAGEPSQDLPALKTLSPLYVNFGDKIQLLAVSLRRLTETPTSFELLCFWRRLKESGMDLRTFVQVENPAGDVVYYGQYRPLTVYSSSHSKDGEIIRDRKVVVLPASLPKASYQIWIGWFDSARATRLEIVNSDSKHRRDCTYIGEVEIQQTPIYGWFRAK